MSDTPKRERTSQPFAPLDGTLAASLERAARLAATALRAPAAVLALVGDDRRCFFGGSEPPEWLAHDPGLLFRSGVCERALHDGTPVIVDDAKQDRPLGPGVAAYALVPLAADDGRPIGILCVVDAVTRQWNASDLAVLTEHAAAAATDLALRRRLARRERVERRQRHEALHDALTGLPNRLLFMERLDRAARRAERRAGSFAIVLLDLDNFRVVNDSLGHTAGDELLVAVARRLSACSRAEDTVARLGGDEFAFLLERIDSPADAARVAERALEALTTAVDISGYEVFTSASFGIALSDGGSTRPEFLLRSADLAMGRAKAGGRARFAVFDPGMHADALERLRLETDLRRAVEKQSFELHYQPIIALGDGRIVGFEALVRWRHPDRGLIAPATFIGVAESTGLIVGLGAWVLTEACRQLRTWNELFPDRAPLTMAVNVSVRQLVRADFVQVVAHALQQHKVDPTRLHLELTESVLIEQPEVAIERLRSLKDLGVQVHLDDFGMGYSSLGVLDRLPLNAVKIDRTFVSAMDREQRFAQLVRTILALAASLNLEVIAEGVSGDAHLAALRNLGCTYGQGYLFSPAVDASAVRAMLEADRRW
ncbi:MAG TPA: EAL domain-containing protein [Gemmatimonadaceae bacterium]|nr:EAL domain-containing protein [Gemmatimonadaceae bacterium]